MRKFVRTPHGLTIIEMMGAMLVSTVLLSGAWQLLQGGMQSYQRGLQTVRMTQGDRRNNSVNSPMREGVRVTSRICPMRIIPLMSSPLSTRFNMQPLL